MESLYNFSGLASGIQWRDMVEKIMQVEAAPIRRIEQRIATIESRSAAWERFRGLVQSADAAARPLADGTAFNAVKTSVAWSVSGEASPVTVSGGSGAQPGTYSVKTLAVAQREKVGSGVFSSKTAALGVSGTLSINGTSLTVAATDSLSAVASKINAAGAGVTAAILSISSTEHRLIVTSDEYGADGITLVDTSGTPLRDLGILDAAGARTSVAEQVTSATGLVDQGTGLAATTGSLLADLGTGLLATDTLTLSGTNGTGTAVSFSAYQLGTSTVGDLLTYIESRFSASGRAATATLNGDGTITVTDGTLGESRIALSITANNEGGGDLSFGAFSVSRHGLDRELVGGADAEMLVDGIYFTRETNTISDIVDGLTLKLVRASDTAVDVTVSRDTAAMKTAIKAFVDAYNAAADYVSAQQSYVEDAATPPLSGDSTLRLMRSALRNAMETRIAHGIAGTWTRLADIGIEVDSNGRYTIDDADLDAALTADAPSVAKVFGLHGTSTASSLSFVGATNASTAGTYAVNVTQAATQATVTGTALLNLYSDTGAADSMTVTDRWSSSEYTIALADGDTAATIAQKLNTEFDTAKAHVATSSAPLYTDAGSSIAITDATVWADVYKDGVGAGVANGDTITISGTQSDGSTFLTTYTVTDAGTQTVGGLRSKIQDALGSAVVVSLENGAFKVTANETGVSLMTLAVSSDNAGGGTLDFGTVDATTVGRGVSQISAEAVGGEIKLTHGLYGSGAGFVVAYASDDGTATVGIAAGTHSGLDVAGTIGGYAAAGAGQVLTGSADTPVEGLAVQYTGSAPAAPGSLTFSRGIASTVALAATPYLASGSDSIEALIDRMDVNVTNLNDGIGTIEIRLENRRADLIRRFTAMEMALARAQQQSAWLSSQVGQLGGTGR